MIPPPYLAVVEAARKMRKLAGLVTVRQVIEAGDEYIEVAGLNPYCMNEGADGDAKIDHWRFDAALSALDDSAPAADEEGKPDQSPFWWCPECKAEVPPQCVTYEENHDVCGSRVVSKVPADAEEDEVTDAMIDAAVHNYRYTPGHDQRAALCAAIRAAMRAKR